MKKVIIFRSELLPPSETFIKEQALALALTDWHPVLAGYRRAANGLDLAGLDVQFLPGMTSGRLRRWHAKWRQWRGRPHAPTVNALKAIGADLLHAHFGPDATDIWPSARAAGLPMVVTLHGYDINIHREWWESGKGGLRRRVYPRRLLAMAQDPHVHFIAVSKAIQARAIEYGIPASKITVAYIGVNIERFKPGGLPIEQRPPRILFVGRMVENKAPLLMVRAFAKARESVPDAQLVMVGGGPLLDSAKKLASELDVPVDFRGICNSNQVLGQLHQASVLCLPSITSARGDAEGFGLVLLEAQACGVPVATSALGGAIEAILPNGTGYAFPPGDTASLAQHIVEILCEDARRKRMSEAAAAYARRRFDIQQLTKCLGTLYTNVISAPTAATRPATIVRPGPHAET